MVTKLLIGDKWKTLNIDLDSRDLEAIDGFLSNELANSAISDRLLKTGKVEINLGYKKVSLKVSGDLIVLDV